MEITKKKRDEYKNKVIEAIKSALINNKERITDLDDIGNEIGFAVSSITCKNGKDLKIWSFEKDDFENGFTHGYSLNDGSH
jgi:hypothetical protein